MTPATTNRDSDEEHHPTDEPISATFRGALARFARAFAPTPTMPSPSFIDTREGRFGYLAAGDPKAPLVLCAHGFPDHAPSFLPLLDHLARAGYRAVAPWMRGYSPSVLGGPYHADQLGADLVALADALGGDERSALVGHDWGAAAAYAVLQQAPGRFARAVTMAVPHPASFFESLLEQPAQLRRSWYMLFFQLPHVPERVVPRSDYRLIRRLWQAWSPGYDLPRDQWQLLRDCLDASMPAPIDYYRALARPLREAVPRIRAQWSAGTIDTPVMVLHGEDDGCIGPQVGRGQARFFTGEYRRHVLPGAGHFLMLDAPDRVAALVLEWLREDA